MATTDKGRPTAKQLSTLAELKAISHPTRMRLFYALKAQGSMTATQLGDVVDESPASVSYHLRQLAASGFVEEAANESGDGRQRWWRPAAHGFSWSAADFDSSPSGVSAADAAKATMLEHQWSRLSEYGRTANSWGADWVQAAFSADNVLRLGPTATAALYAELAEVVEKYKASGSDAVDDDDTATVMVVMHGFPTQM